MADRKNRHKWDAPLRGFVASATCTKCGITVDKMGVLGLWYYNPKTGEKGHSYQECISTEAQP